MVRDRPTTHSTRSKAHHGPACAQQLDNGGHVRAVPLAAQEEGQHGAADVVAHAALANRLEAVAADLSVLVIISRNNWVQCRAGWLDACSNDNYGTLTPAIVHTTW